MKTQNHILTSAVLRILRPLARIMLRNGVACGNFEELVRKAYVDEAFSEAAYKHEKATISSVSAQTGLSRKEVKRLLEQNKTDETNTGSTRYNRATRVISGWLNDRRFSSDENIALALPIENGDNSFARLVKEYSGDIPTKAMLKTLEAAGCVKTIDGFVHLVKHAYVPGNDSEDILNILGADTNELINTIDHNLTCDEANRYFQRKVSMHGVDANALPEFNRYVRKHSQALLENFDSWLSEHQTDSEQADTRYVSLAIFYYEQDPDREELS